MSQPKNITASPAAQVPTTSRIQFANEGHGFLLNVADGESSREALELAERLSNGVELMLSRMAKANNNGDENTYMDELGSLAFLAGTAAALVSSVGRALPTEGGDE